MVLQAAVDDRRFQALAGQRTRLPEKSACQNAGSDKNETEKEQEQTAIGASIATISHPHSLRNRSQVGKRAGTNASA